MIPSYRRLAHTPLPERLAEPLVKSDVGAAKPIDRLFGIAHQEQLAGERRNVPPVRLLRIIRSEKQEDLSLQRVSILKLVHKDVLELVLQVFADRAVLDQEIADLEKEVRKFQGTWTFESSETGGKELPAGELKRLLLTFEGEKHTVKTGDDSKKVSAGKSTTEAMQSIELTVGSNSIKIDQTGITIKRMMVSIEGQATLDAKSPMTTVKGDGMLTLKGGITMIN